MVDRPLDLVARRKEFKHQPSQGKCEKNGCESRVTHIIHGDSGEKLTYCSKHVGDYLITKRLGYVLQPSSNGKAM